MENLTEEQKAMLKKVEELLSKKENQEHITSMKTVDEVVAFFEENGFSFTEEQKCQIKQIAESKMKELEDKELTDDVLSEVAGGWSWGGSLFGLFQGGLLGYVAVPMIVANPATWLVVAVTAGAAAVGSGIGGVVGDYTE